MDGDMKDIVLARLEKRLKEKDDEIRGLKLQINNGEGQNESLKSEIEALREKVDHLEDEVIEAQSAMSQILKKVGVLESVLAGIMATATVDEEPEIEEVIDPDLLLDGQEALQDMLLYNKYIAAKTDPMSLMDEVDEDSHPPENGSSENKDALRFFHIGKNT